MIETENPDSSLFAIKLDYKCPLLWKDMDGDERRRFCSKCKQNVYNVSELTRQEAVELISEKEGDLCVRFYQRKDGTVITRDCFSILGAGSVRAKWNIFAIINGVVAAAALALMPMLGPACVTIVQGVGPIMADPHSAGSDAK